MTRVDIRQGMEFRCGYYCGSLSYRVQLSSGVTRIFGVGENFLFWVGGGGGGGGGKLTETIQI